MLDRLYPVTFVYADATVGPVYLLGSFNGWDPTGHPLRRVDGVWQVTVYLPAGVYPYLFATGDGGRSVPRHATPDGDGERYARVAVPDDLPGLRAA